MNLRKASIAVSLFAAVLAAAWLLGAQAGNLVNNSKTKDYQQRRQTQTKQILEQMGTISVGDTLPNYALEDLEGKIWQLSELIDDKAIISFYKPDCGACEQQLDEFKKSGLDPSKLILISPDNPLHLKALALADGIESVILYDENRAVTEALGITISPFNIVLNHSLVIERIEAGSMRADELAGEFQE